MTTSCKLDLNEVVRILKSFETSQAATDFANDLASMLRYDDKYKSRVITNTDQRAIFTRILDCTNSLLSELETIRREDIGDDIWSCADIHTATLIMMSRSTLNQEELAIQNPHKKFKSLPSIDNAVVDYRYPTQLIESLQEMRDAVVHAIEKVRAKKGNSVNRDTKKIRRDLLADHYVSNFFIRFGKLPPLTPDGPEHQIFDLLIYAANLSEKSNFSCFRRAIERAIAHKNFNDARQSSIASL